MKTKNMRKKALLSSLAMLLVAVIALGGATYAWFSTNSSATATGVNLKAKEDTNLLFAPTDTTDLDDPDAWQANVPLSTDLMEVVPCSSVNGVNLFKVTVGNTASTAEESTVLSIDSASDQTDYFKGDFLAKCSKAAYMKLDSITFPGTGVNDWEDLLRVSVTVASSGSTAQSETKIFYTETDAPDNIAIQKAVANPGDGVTLSTLYAATPTTIGTTENVKAYANYIKPGTVATTVDGSEADTSVFGLVQFSNSAALTVTVRVWLEGNDEDCVNTYMRTVVSGMVLSFSVSGTANGYVGS